MLTDCFPKELLKMSEGLKMGMKLFRIVALGFGLVLAGVLQPAFLPDAQAAKVKALQVTPEIEDAAARINAYFNSFQTLKGEFVQTGAKGRSTRGVMHLSKPGKLRFEYEPPNPLLIASDGKWLTIKNKVKEKGDQVPLSSTPMRLIVASKLNLLAETSVVQFEQINGLTTMGLVDKKGSIAGQIYLVFDDARGELVQWIIVDGKGQRTTVELSNLEKNVKMNPKLFNVTINREKRP
jgi:outer membrane lipoprotein-sorting protein